MLIRSFLPEDKAAVIALWQDIFSVDSPHNDPQTSLDKKLRHDRDLLLVAVIDDGVVGTVIGGYDGHRGWIYSLAVKPELRRRGIASTLVNAIEEKLVALGCLKVNLQVLASNADVITLYEGLGYHVEERISMGKRLYK